MSTSAVEVSIHDTSPLLGAGAAAGAATDAAAGSATGAAVVEELALAAVDVAGLSAVLSCANACSNCPKTINMVKTRKTPILVSMPIPCNSYEKKGPARPALVVT